MIKSNSIKYLKADFILVIKTRFPFFEFFYQIMGLMLNIVKAERSKAYAQYKASGDLDNFAKRFDHRYLIRVLKEQGNAFLENLALHKAPTFEKSLIVNWAGFQLNLFVPERPLTRHMNVLYGIQAIVNNTSWSSFYTIFICLLLEKSIVFVHEDREMLSKYM